MSVTFNNKNGPQVDADKLRAQVDDYLPSAIHFTANQTCGTLDAWRLAIASAQRHHGTATAHPCDALLPCLIRFGAHGQSTSGVERLFARGHCHAGICRADMSEQLINDELNLICDVDFEDTDLLLQRAQSIWLSVYKSVRTGNRRSRMDIGKPRAPKNALSLAQSLRDRTADITQLVDRSAAAFSDSMVPVAELWSDGHAKEAAFQQQKRVFKLLESADTVLESDLTPRLAEAASLFKIYQQRVGEAYARKKAVAAEACEPQRLSGSVMWADPALRNRLLKKVCHSLTIDVVTDRMRAKTFLVRDVLKLPQRVAWCLALGGGMACELEYVVSNGEDGRCMVYEATGNRKRTAWASDAFIQNHNVIFGILAEKASPPTGSWKWMRRGAQCWQGKQPALVFVTAAEFDSEDSRQCQSCVNVSQMGQSTANGEGEDMYLSLKTFAPSRNT